MLKIYYFYNYSNLGVLYSKTIWITTFKEYCTKWRGTKEPLDESEKGEWKKLAWNSILRKLTSWHPVPSLHGKQMGKQWKQWKTIYLGSIITADGDFSHEIKRHLLLGRKAMTNIDSIFKSRDITLPTKIGLVKAMVFLVVIYGCENWTIKKAEC